MSWQRIDENTYIDNTLVTCAEYQLFIDEMREQGKYYQPDHWTSFQYPEGQAKEPILGVRHSDAVAFCDWLTDRDASEWAFRLPTQREAKDFPIETIGKTVGNWLNDQSQFGWVGQVPSDARGIYSLEGVFARNLIFSKDLEIGPSIGLRFQFRDLQLKGTFDKVFDQAINLAIDRIFGHVLAQVRNNAINLDQAINSSDNRLDGRLFSRKQTNPSLVVELALRFTFLDIIADAFAIIRGLKNDATHAISIGAENRIIFGDIDQDFELFLHIYLDCLTLQERIAGRSPAFEGIRLVKERIR